MNEYFSPRAKKRWCLSHYDNVGHNTLGVSPQAATVCLLPTSLFFFLICACLYHLYMIMVLNHSKGV